MTLEKLKKQAEKEFDLKGVFLDTFLGVTLIECKVDLTGEQIAELKAWCSAHMISFAAIFAHEILAQKRKDYLETKERK